MLYAYVLTCFNINSWKFLCNYSLNLKNIASYFFSKDVEKLPNMGIFDFSTTKTKFRWFCQNDHFISCGLMVHKVRLNADKITKYFRWHNFDISKGYANVKEFTSDDKREIYLNELKYAQSTCRKTCSFQLHLRIFRNLIEHSNDVSQFLFDIQWSVSIRFESDKFEFLNK